MRTTALAIDFQTGSRLKKHYRTATSPLGEKYIKLKTELVETPFVSAIERPQLKSKAMKRINNLYEKIISPDNLRRAEAKARRGKAGSYGVRLFDRDPEGNLLALHEALLTKTFKTSPYEVYTIHKPKERLIHRLPYYPDRIVHHAIMNVLEPIWVSVFPYNTYSCIKHRGVEAARKRMRKILADPIGSRYCLKIDVRKFYPSVPHDVIKAIYRKKIKCRDTLWLLDEIVDSINGTPDPLDPTRECVGRSLPIGNYPSPFLANLLLAYLLHSINTEFPQVKGVVYADDGVFFAATKGALRDLREFISEGLARLGLSLRSNWQIFPVARNREDKQGRGVDFLGYVFYSRQTLIRKSIKRNFCRRVARLYKRLSPLSPIAFKRAVCSWLGWFKHCNAAHLLRAIIAPNYYPQLTA